MIALPIKPFRILSFGLNESENHFVQDTIALSGGEIVFVDSDLDLWHAAREMHFDLCLLGQSLALPYPTLRIWMLRALQPFAQVAVLYDDIGTVETDPLQDCDNVDVFQRPVDPCLLHAIFERSRDSAGIVDEESIVFPIERSSVYSVY